jgi:hypothetical protein
MINPAGKSNAPPQAQEAPKNQGAGGAPPKAPVTAGISTQSRKTELEPVPRPDVAAHRPRLAAAQAAAAAPQVQAPAEGTPEDRITAIDRWIKDNASSGFFNLLIGDSEGRIWRAL